ncbi:MAG: tRNA threonylcarbamoyladenosine dehydratase [Eubacterium sp.]|nr:tRNA threonylcarbamoyladenosine dehydratase [Eubacterium sp.]
MKEMSVRTAMILQEEGVEKLGAATVAVFGLGGVGGYVTEALARAGIGCLHLIDNDTFSESNLNRQILALHSTLGMKKTEAAKRRVLDINPECNVVIHDMFFLPETAGEIDFSAFDYVVDAVDTVTAKLAIIEAAKNAGVPVISVMGTGNKLDASAFEVADISKTSVCPLAKVMRRELKKRGIEGVKVVYSREDPKGSTLGDDRGRHAPGSVSYVPGAAGLLAAGEVIKHIAGI